MLNPVTDRAEAQWVVDALHVGSPRLPSIVPPLYERYVRIVHPGWDEPDEAGDAPVQGSMPGTVSESLRRILSAHTPSRHSCWFGVWIGFGLTPKPEVPDTVSIKTRSREWDLFRGPIQILNFRFFVEFEQSANIAWPEDRSWFVATEIDISSTYVGGSEALVRDLLNDKELKAVKASVSDDVFGDNDRLRELVAAR